MEKIHVTVIFFFSHSVSRRPLSLSHLYIGVRGKGLTSDLNFEPFSISSMLNGTYFTSETILQMESYMQEAIQLAFKSKSKGQVINCYQFQNLLTHSFSI